MNVYQPSKPLINTKPSTSYPVLVHVQKIMLKTYELPLASGQMDCKHIPTTGMKHGFRLYRANPQAQW